MWRQCNCMAFRWVANVGLEFSWVVTTLHISAFSLSTQACSQVTSMLQQVISSSARCILKYFFTACQFSGFAQSFESRAWSECLRILNSEKLQYLTTSEYMSVGWGGVCLGAISLYQSMVLQIAVQRQESACAICLRSLYPKKNIRDVAQRNQLHTWASQVDLVQLY